MAMKSTVRDEQLSALQRLADLSGKLSAIGMHEMANEVAEATGQLAQYQGYHVQDVFGAP